MCDKEKGNGGRIEKHNINKVKEVDGGNGVGVSLCPTLSSAKIGACAPSQITTLIIVLIICIGLYAVFCLLYGFMVKAFSKS